MTLMGRATAWDACEQLQLSCLCSRGQLQDAPALPCRMHSPAPPCVNDGMHLANAAASAMRAEAGADAEGEEAFLQAVSAGESRSRVPVHLQLLLGSDSWDEAIPLSKGAHTSGASWNAAWTFRADGAVSHRQLGGTSSVCWSATA